MAKPPEIILGAIQALKLAPGDILVVHSTQELTPDQRRELDHELQKQLWGKPNPHMVIAGPFSLAAVIPTKGQEPTVTQLLLCLKDKGNPEQTEFVANWLKDLSE
jgi:hypothetical protein